MAARRRPPPSFSPRPRETRELDRRVRELRRYSVARRRGELGAALGDSGSADDDEEGASSDDDDDNFYRGTGNRRAVVSFADGERSGGGGGAAAAGTTRLGEPPKAPPPRRDAATDVAAAQLVELERVLARRKGVSFRLMDFVRHASRAVHQPDPARGGHRVVRVSRLRASLRALWSVPAHVRGHSKVYASKLAKCVPFRIPCLRRHDDLS